MHTPIRRLGAVMCAAVVGLSSLVVPTAEAGPAVDPATDLAARFTLGVLPDTQFYSRYATQGQGDLFMERYGSNPFESQTRFWAERSDELGTRMVLHLGDVVDRANNAQEWAVADTSMKVLEDADVDYSILGGNHDMPYATYTRTFSAERAALNESLVERDPATGAHEYHRFEVDSQPFAVLALTWDADETALAWADALLSANADVPTILTSHQLINVDTDAETAISTSFGDKVWNRLISRHDQVFLTFNGHHHGAAHLVRTNSFGNPVHQILMDHQMAYMGGNGYMGLVEFDLTNGRIEQTTFSNWVTEKPTGTLNSFDQPILQGGARTFGIDFDFRGRFPGLSVGAADKPSYTDALRAELGAFTAPEEQVQRDAQDGDDYPVVDGTLAHWRVPVVGEPVIAGVGTVIPDIAGDNDMTRAPLNQGPVTGARAGDVTFRSDFPKGSSNFASVCFANASRDGNVASYFTTAQGAPLNLEEFENGFTFETFVRIDPAFDTAKNAWMAWLSRDGQRGNVAGYASGEHEEPPFAWAMSTLREVQFSFMESAGPQKNDFSAWSGEIVNLSDWMHIAVVGDAVEETVTMYINGVPVLRNVKQAVGVGAEGDLPWVMGAGSYGGGRGSGFLGCLGETRIVDHALEADQWLTARVSEPQPTPTPEPSATPTASASPSATPTTTPPAKPRPTPGYQSGNVYTTPGYHEANGRRWLTTCETYSQTYRCRTEIWASQIRRVEGRYVSVNDWAFNNLTYLPAGRSLWSGNPLAETGTWTAADGRRWRTECGTAATGRDACRTYATASVARALPGGGHRVEDVEVFNNITMFTA